MEGWPTKFRNKIAAGLTLAIASIIALAACSSDGSSSGAGIGHSSSRVTVPGGIGSVPVAPSGEKVKAGTITWAMAAEATPNWIFPVIPSAFYSIYNAFTFIDEMWRPVYWTVNGVVPEVEQNMSIANEPKCCPRGSRKPGRT